MAGLTPAQKKVFEFIRDHIDRNGYSPSFDEVRRHMGFQSLNSVSKHLKRLERRGYISIPEKNQKRALDLAPRRKLLLRRQPGTGKTLTASALAAEHSLPLFVVRLDRLITQFMGETAAKLRLVFDATAQTRAA